MFMNIQRQTPVPADFAPHKREFARRLHWALKQTHYTQRQAADALGVPIKTFESWICGDKLFPKDLRVLLKIAKLLGTNAPYLSSFTNYPGADVYSDKAVIFDAKTRKNPIKKAG